MPKKTEKMVDISSVSKQPRIQTDKPKMKILGCSLPIFIVTLLFISFIVFVIVAFVQDQSAKTPTTLPSLPETPVIEESPVESQNENTTITLIAGENNEYAELLTMNAGTEFEETQYVYYLPAGTYTATNINENYPGQINVYSRDISVNEEGLEEPAETFFVKLLQVGESTEVTINKDQYIEIHEPDQFELQKVA